MTKRTYLKQLALSILAFLILIPLGGYGGHHIKFLLASIIYFILAIYFLKAAASTREQLTSFLIIILPPVLIYLPIHISLEAYSAIISTAGHFTGALFGAAVYFATKKVKIMLTLTFLLGSIWVTTTGHSMWLHNINFGTFTGKVDYQSPQGISGMTQLGRTISDKDLKGKVILLDFWHTSCGACFKKFPQLQKINDRYQLDTSIVIIAVNKPLKRDAAGQAFAVIKDYGFTFPVLIPDLDSLPENFGVQVYPTTVLIDRTGKVVFKGALEKAETMVNNLMRKEESFNL